MLRFFAKERLQMSERFEVVLETTLWYSVYVSAEDKEAAQDKALERGVPQVHLPKGFELNDNWFVEGVVAVNDE